MRLKEEKTLIVLEAIILLFIVLSSILLQIADAKIKNYNDKINLAELKRSQNLQKLTYYSQRTGYWEVFDFLNKANFGVHFKKKDAEVNEENLDKETKSTLEKYEAEKINEQELMEEMINNNREKTRNYESITNELAVQIENMYKDSPGLFWLNAFLLQRICFSTQFIGIFLALILYLYLFKEISKRT